MNTQQHSVAQKPVVSALSTEFRKALILQHKAQKTINTYIGAVATFVNFHYGFNPLDATVNHLRAFFFHLKEEKQYAPRTYNQYFYGLKAFYEIFMPDVPLMASFRRMRTKDNNITIVTRFEFEDMLRHTLNLKHRAMLEVFYGCGIRLEECVNLKFSDIDRRQMLVHVHGKGDKQRFTILPQRTLLTLQQYYVSEKQKPTIHVFEGSTKKPMSPNSFEHAVRQAAARAGIKKKSRPTFCGTALLLIFSRLTVGSMSCRSF